MISEYALETPRFWGEWPSRLRRLCDQNRKVLGSQTPLGPRPGLGVQPRYEAPGDLRFEMVKRLDEP